jgi:YHS domain-containing protein
MTIEDKASTVGKTDPPPRKFHTVCRRVLLNTDPQYFPSAQYHGRKIYFCTESCLNAFLADPEPFYKAHACSKKRIHLVKK